MEPPYVGCYNGESGVALVITLILLSVITFMAITFLVVSRGEKSTVGAMTEQTTARLAAETALEVAQSQFINYMLAFTNPYSIGMFVSTNYINPAGFVRANGAYLTNCSYAYPNGTPINNDNDSRQNIANLFYLPRVPVFTTNPITRQVEFVYYIDINRNGRFETNGLQPVISPTGGFYNTNGQPIGAIIPGNTLSNNLVGEPEWIGMLERGNFIPGLYCNTNNKAFYFPPGFPHSADNMFISRYAYLVIPTSSTLDLNYIHNYAKEMEASMPADAFWRNQGVGSWEINLAALLADLNTNFWDPITAPYTYVKNTGNHNTGFAFDDAVTLLRYRYNRAWNQNNLAPVAANFGAANASLFTRDNVDGYSFGLMTGPWWNPDSDTPIRVSRAGWFGSDNPSNFFDPQDLFDTTKTAVPPAGSPGPVSPNITDRLKAAGNGTSSYDRYTFDRLLQVLGVDSAPESPKLNLNYANVDSSGTIVPNLATNFVPWQPVQFFTNAAARMLADAGYGTNVVQIVGGIPRVHIKIYPQNYYTPSVHRYLQLAANIYDANLTTNTTSLTNVTGFNGFPSVFRPIFHDDGQGISNAVWITGYFEVTNYANQFKYIGISTNTAQSLPIHDLQNEQHKQTVGAFDMVYGVPLVVGAKKGFPNFNEFGLLQDISVSRNLVFHRLGAGSFNTNQIYTMGISNVFALEAWNSYAATYPLNLDLIADVDLITAVTNEAGICQDRLTRPLSNIYSAQIVTNILPSTWLGYRSAQSRQSFVFPLGAQSDLFLTNSDFAFNQNRFLPSSQNTTDPVNYFPIPRWKVKHTTRVRFALVDRQSQRIIDYVNLSSPEEPIDVAELLKGTDQGAEATCNGNFNGEIGSLFCTNRPGGSLLPSVATYGILNQLGISMGSIQVGDSIWRPYNVQVNDKQFAIDEFRRRILSSTDTTSDFSAPFTPRRFIHHSISWQANDPLVHYTIGDLEDPMSGKRKISYDTDGRGSISGTDNPLIGFPLPGQTGSPALNGHYRPWPGNPNKQGDTTPPTRFRVDLKDSAMTNSDNWSFMTNRFPNVGWLGRVHRGTPWQTVYLKSPNADIGTWTNWVGNNYMLMNYDDRGSSNYDCVFSMPTNDYRIFDLFTTAFNDNASRGQLSVNQTNLAAWSAVLSGVLVNTNGTTNGYTWIEPAGNYDPLNPPPIVRILNGINKARANPTNNPFGLFTHRGDILSAPELTTGSPYFPTNAPLLMQSLPDWAYERIPQQIMGLLRSGDEPPRFVIYAFGQALKPAEHSLVTASGSFFGMPTNYQVTAESVIRAVVRVDNVPTPRAPNNIPRVYVESFNVLPPY